MINPGKDFNLIFSRSAVTVGAVRRYRRGLRYFSFLNRCNEIALVMFELGSVHTTMATFSKKMGLREAISGSMKIGVGKIDGIVDGRVFLGGFD